MGIESLNLHYTMRPCLEKKKLKERGKRSWDFSGKYKALSSVSSNLAVQLNESARPASSSS